MLATNEPAIPFQKAEYRGLDSRQQEVYNFHHIAAMLARYGYASYPIRDDWNGGDMLARHMVEGCTIVVQVKSRVTFAEKYRGKNIWIGFPAEHGIYVYPHDKVLDQYLKVREDRGMPLTDNQAWSRDKIVHWVKPTEELAQLLQPFFLPE